MNDRRPAEHRMTWMSDRHRARVLEIEAASGPDPLTAADVKAMECRNHVVRRVVEWGVRADAYLFHEILPEGNRVEILRLAVHPEFRRRGLGRWLAETLAATVRDTGRASATARVRESNLGGHMFLRSVGFRAARVDRGFFPDSGEAAYVFVFPGDAAVPAPPAAAVKRGC